MPVLWAGVCALIRDEIIAIKTRQERANALKNGAGKKKDLDFRLARFELRSGGQGHRRKQATNLAGFQRLSGNFALRCTAR